MPQQQMKQPIRRMNRVGLGEEEHEETLWPLSAREFMKLPVTSLTGRGRRTTKQSDNSTVEER